MTVTPCLIPIVGSISTSLLLTSLRVPTAAEATTAVVVGTILGTAFFGGIVYAIREITKAQTERQKVLNKAFIETQLERDQALKDTLSEQNREMKEQLDDLQAKLKEASRRAAEETILSRDLRTDLKTAVALNLELTRKLLDMTAQVDRTNREMSDRDAKGKAEMEALRKHLFDVSTAVLGSHGYGARPPAPNARAVPMPEGKAP